MGRGARYIGSKAHLCSRCIPVADVCEANSTADHGFTVWLHQKNCQNLQCGPNNSLEKTEERNPAACLPDFKHVILVLSIALSSRILGGPSEELAGKGVGIHHRGKCKSKRFSHAPVCTRGTVYTALFLLLLFLPLLCRFPKRDDSHYLVSSQIRRGPLEQAGQKPSFPPCGLPDLLSFQEAPSFRNEMGCPVGDGEGSYICNPTFVHIVMTLDGAYLRGSIAAVYSILQHALCPENVVLHFLATDHHGCFRSLMRSTFPSLKFKIYDFEASVVRDLISSSVRQALEQPLNYARNYMADMLEPCVRKVIYLDSDLVVVDDIFRLWTIKLHSHTVAAPEYCHANFSKYFSSSFWQDPVLAKTFDGRKPCYFNTGVMVIDLDKWRRQNCTKTIEQWMQVQKERRIYELGSLPPFLLAFAGAVQPVDHRWNQHGLGGDSVKGSCRALHLGPVSLLHWSGEGKPWSRLDSRHPCPLDSLWAPYDLYVNSFY